MNLVYWVIGYVAFWVAIGVGTVWLLVSLGGFLWKKWIKDLWHGSYLNCLIDYMQMYRQAFRDPASNTIVQGELLWHYERHLKSGAFKHHFKKQMLAGITKLVAGNERIRTAYQETSKIQNHQW